MREVRYAIDQTVCRDCDILGVEVRTEQKVKVYVDKESAREIMHKRAEDLEDIYTHEDRYYFSKSVRLVNEQDHVVIMVRHVDKYGNSQIIVFALSVREIYNY